MTKSVNELLHASLAEEGAATDRSLFAAMRKRLAEGGPGEVSALLAEDPAGVETLAWQFAAEADSSLTDTEDALAALQRKRSAQKVDKFEFAERVGVLRDRQRRLVTDGKRFRLIADRARRAVAATSGEPAVELFMAGAALKCGDLTIDVNAGEHVNWKAYFRRVAATAERYGAWALVASRQDGSTVLVDLQDGWRDRLRRTGVQSVRLVYPADQVPRGETEAAGPTGLEREGKS